MYYTVVFYGKLLVIYNKEGRGASGRTKAVRWRLQCSCHRGMSGCGGNTQMHNTLVAVEGRTADLNAGSGRAA